MQINNQPNSCKIPVTRTSCSLYRSILPSLSLIGAGVLVVLGVRKKLPLQKAAIGAGTCAAVAVASKVLACRLQKLDVQPIMRKIAVEGLDILDFLEIHIEALSTNQSQDSYAKELFIEIVKNLPTGSTLRQLKNWPKFELSIEDVPTRIKEESSQALVLLPTTLRLLPEGATIRINNKLPTGWTLRKLEKRPNFELSIENVRTQVEGEISKAWALVSYALPLLAKGATIRIDEFLVCQSEDAGVFEALKSTKGKLKIDKLKLLNAKTDALNGLQGKIEVNVLEIDDRRSYIDAYIPLPLLLDLDPKEIWISRWDGRENIINFNSLKDNYNLECKIQDNPRPEQLTKDQQGLSRREKEKIYKKHRKEAIERIERKKIRYESRDCKFQLLGVCRYNESPTCSWEYYFKKKTSPVCKRSA